MITFTFNQFLVKSNSDQSMADIPLRVWAIQFIMAIIGGLVMAWILSRIKKQ